MPNHKDGGRPEPPLVFRLFSSCGAIANMLPEGRCQSFDSDRPAIATETWSASWPRPQGRLALCCDDERQAAGHRHVLEEVNKLSRVKRCTDGLPKWMRHEGRGYEEEQQAESRNAGINSQGQARAGDELQRTRRDNQGRNEAGWGPVRGEFVLCERLANDVESIQEEHHGDKYARRDHGIPL